MFIHELWLTAMKEEAKRLQAEQEKQACSCAVGLCLDPCKLAAAQKKMLEEEEAAEPHAVSHGQPPSWSGQEEEGRA